jgi:hypothetical protein
MKKLLLLLLFIPLISFGQDVKVEEFFAFVYQTLFFPLLLFVVLLVDTQYKLDIQYPFLKNNLINWHNFGHTQYNLLTFL